MLSLFRSGFTLFTLRASQSVFNFLVLALLSHRMSEPNMATLLLLLSVVMVGARLAVFGFDVTLLKAYGASQNPARIFAGSLIGFLGLWLPLGLGLMAFPPLSAPVILWLFLASLQVFQSSTLIALGLPKAGFLTSGALTAFLVFIPLLGMASPTLGMFIYLNIFALLINALLAHMLILRRTGSLTRPAAIAPLLKSALPSMLTNTFLYASAQIPLWFLVVFAGDAAVVNYGIAFRVAVALGMILEVSRSLILPRFSQAFHSGTLPKVEPVLRQITTLAALTTAALSLTVLLFSDLVFGELFNRPGQPVFWLALWLLAAQTVLAGLGPSHMALRIGGQQGLALGLSVASIAALSLAMAALYPAFGPAGIAFAVFATTLGFG